MNRRSRVMCAAVVALGFGIGCVSILSALTRSELAAWHAVGNDDPLSVGADGYVDRSSDSVAGSLHAIGGPASGVGESGGSPASGNRESKAVMAGWWSDLPRRGVGWFTRECIIDEEALADPHQWARCEDLNPGDVPWGSATFDKVVAMFFEQRGQLRVLAETRRATLNQEITALIDSGAIPPASVRGLSNEDAAAYEREVRFARRERQSKEASTGGGGGGIESPESLALLNTLGHSSRGGVVQVRPDGSMYSASIQHDLPRTFKADCDLRELRFGLAIQCIASAADSRCIDVDGMNELAHAVWRRLGMMR